MTKTLKILYFLLQEHLTIKTLFQLKVQIKLQVEILRGQYDGHPNDIKISRLNGALQIENSINSLSNIRPHPKKTWQ